jgi:hypothetical protein
VYEVARVMVHFRFRISDIRFLVNCDFLGCFKKMAPGGAILFAQFAASVRADDHAGRFASF